MTARQRHREAGFTTVELLVAMIIIAVLLAVGILGVRAAKTTGSRASAVSVARAYEQSIDRFAATHGGDVPRLDGVDWPASDAAKGPVTDVNGTRRHYLKSVPESVQDGRVVIGVGTPPAITGSASSVTYVLDGPGYRLEVRGPDRETCAVYGQGGAPDGSDPRAC